MCKEAAFEGSLADLAGQLPSVVAVVIREYAQEVDAYSKLHRLTDAAEMITRFLCVIAINDVYAQLGTFPRDYRNNELRRLRQPTFDGWKAMVSGALETLRRSGNQAYLGELRWFWEKVWNPLINDNDGDYTAHILPLRNHLAHVGRLSDQHAQMLLNAHQDRFEQSLRRLSFLANYQLIAVDAEQHPWHLCGNTAERRPLDARSVATVLERNRVYLFQEGRLLQLFPLQLYELVDPSLTAQGDHTQLHPAPMLYLRYNAAHRTIEYTALDPNFGFAQLDRVVEPFLEMFRLDEWEEERKREEARNAGQREIEAELRQNGYDFDDLESAFPDLGGLWGRKEQLTEVQKWIATHTDTGGTLCISGKPGVGKSAFMMGLWKRVRSDKRFRSIIKMRYFFRAGDARCSARGFYQAAVLNLVKECGPDLLIPDNLELDPRLAFEKTLERARAQTDRPMLFCLDGIDEVMVSCLDFIEDLLSSSATGVIWVIAGRSLPDAGDHFDREAIAPLGEKDMRAWLTEEIGHQKYALMNRDEECEDQSYRNPFVDTLVERSEGFPLYVRHVIDDLRFGRRTVYDEANLPRGMAEYYGALIAGQQIGDEIQILTDVLMVLLAALEPLPTPALSQILEPLYGYLDDAPRLLANALRRASFLLHTRAVPEGGTGWTLYHQALREHLRCSPSVANARSRAQHLLTQWCARWDEHNEPYALRNYARHLASLGRWLQLRQLLIPENGQTPWAKVRYAQEGSYAGSLDDVRLLWESAADTQDVALQVACALVETSIRAHSASIVQDLEAALQMNVSAGGHLDMKKILEHINTMPDGETKIWSLQRIARQADPLLFSRILGVVSGISEQRVRADALLRLLPDCPDSSLAEVRQLAADLNGDDWIRVTALMIPRLGERDKAEALAAVRSAINENTNPNYRAARLLALAPQVPGFDRIVVLRDARKALSQVTNTAVQARELKRLSVEMAILGCLEDAVMAANTVTDHYGRVEALVQLRPALPEAMEESVISAAHTAAERIGDPKLRAKAFRLVLTRKGIGLPELAPFISGPEAPFSVGSALWDERLVGSDEGHWWPSESAPTDDGQTIGDLSEEVACLGKLAHLLPENCIPELRESLFALIGKPAEGWEELSLQVRLLPYVPAHMKEKVIAEGLSLACDGCAEEDEDLLQTSSERDGVLRELALAAAQWGYHEQAVDAARTIAFEPKRMECLFAVLRDLPDAWHAAIKDAALSTLAELPRDEWYDDDVLDAAATGFADFGWYDEALATARQIDFQSRAVDTLVGLAQRLPPSLRPDLLEIIRQIPLPSDRIGAYLDLLPHLPHDEQQAVAGEIQSLVDANGGAAVHPGALIWLIPYCPSIALEPILANAFASLEFVTRDTRDRDLAYLAYDLLAIGRVAEAVETMRLVPRSSLKEVFPVGIFNLIKSGRTDFALKAIDLVLQPHEQVSALDRLLDLTKVDDQYLVGQRMLDLLDAADAAARAAMQKRVFLILLRTGHIQEAIAVGKTVHKEATWTNLPDDLALPSELPPEVAEAFLRFALDALGHQPRSVLLRNLPALAPAIVALGGRNTIAGVVTAIQGVCYGWS